MMGEQTKSVLAEMTIAIAVGAVVLLTVGCSPQPQAVPSQTSRETLSASDAIASSSSSLTEAPSIQTEWRGSSDSALAAQLETSLQTTAETSGMQVGAVVIDLPTGTCADYQGDESMVSASMIKLIIAATFLEQVEAGVFSLDGAYTLQASDIVGGTGSLGSRGVGVTTTYRELVQMMISESDNTATNILINAVGMDAVNAEASKLELTGTQLNRYMMDSEAMAAGIENYTSAKDVAALLRMICDGTFVDSECSSLVLQALENQQDYGGILDGLPSGVMFAHKTGTLGTVRHDGGIVEGDHPFIVVVLCGGPGFYESGALSTMAQIGSAAYADIIG